MQNDYINRLIYLGERLSNNIVFMIEDDMNDYAIKCINEIIEELENIKENIKEDEYEQI